MYKEQQEATIPYSDNSKDLPLTNEDSKTTNPFHQKTTTSQITAIIEDTQFPHHTDIHAAINFQHIQHPYNQPQDTQHNPYTSKQATHHEHLPSPLKFFRMLKHFRILIKFKIKFRKYPLKFLILKTLNLKETFFLQIPNP